MFDIITVVGIWMLSLPAAFVSVRQPKGSDWYAPISSKQKMLMSLVNMAVGLLVITLLLLTIDGQIKKVIVVSSLCIIIILFFSANKIRNGFDRIKKVSASAPLKTMPEEIKTDKEIEREEENNTLNIVFAKILTVFNTVFTLLNIAYMFYIHKNLGIEAATVTDILTADSTLPVHAALLFWTTISAIALTSSGWHFDDTVSSATEGKRRVSHSVKFFAKRITDRNRK